MTVSRTATPPPSWYDQLDRDNARRFVCRFGFKVRRFADKGWLMFDGVAWVPLEESIVRQYASQLIDEVAEEARSLRLKAVAMRGREARAVKREANRMDHRALRSRAPKRLQAMLNAAAQMNLKDPVML